MGRLRRLIGIVLLAAVVSLGVPTVLADGPQESPGITGPQESPGLTGPQESPGLMIDLLNYIASTLTR